MSEKNTVGPVITEVQIIPITPRDGLVAFVSGLTNSMNEGYARKLPRILTLVLYAKKVAKLRSLSCRTRKGGGTILDSLPSRLRGFGARHLSIKIYPNRRGWSISA